MLARCCTGADIDALAFLFLQPVASVWLEDLSYAGIPATGSSDNVRSHLAVNLQSQLQPASCHTEGTRHLQLSGR